MLKGIPAVISPDLLKTLCEMGHGDLLVLGDANFPAKTCAAQRGAALIRADGLGVSVLLDAILRLLPLDYSEKAVFLMEPDRPIAVPIFKVYEEIVSRYDSRGGGLFERIERFSYYDLARQAACVVQTGETALYANIILRKGVVEG
ncbi:MAG: RbsD/FucU family protein [Oscillospiraceae bacterium]|nr:RbsD/FucU family protein [Oscillospiraceae bacterium]